MFHILIYRTGNLEIYSVKKGLKNMYKKAVSLLALGSFVILAAFMCVKGANAAWVSAKPVCQLKLELARLEEKAEEREKQEALWLEGGGIGIADMAVSGQRIVDYAVLEQQLLYKLSDEELEVLLRIVEAEAGSEDEEGKLLVANVVLNRMNSDRFPDTVTEVVFQEERGITQFSPVSNGSYYRVEVSEETVSAVGRALTGEDISQGALFFAARKYADSSKMKWFDENLTYLFVHGGHEFFK